MLEPQRGGRLVPCVLLQTVGSPLLSPYAFKKQNKTNFLQRTQENVWHLLLSSILAVFHYLSNGTLILCQEKYLFPILIMLPDYPLVYILPGLLSIHAAIWKILTWLRWNLSLTVLARAGMCSRVDARSSQGEGSALRLPVSTAPM